MLIGILIPPYILALEFKSKEELQLMPQTMEEHLDELEDDASEENVSVDSFEDDQVIIFFYAPNFKEVKGAYCFFLGACLCVNLSIR